MHDHSHSVHVQGKNFVVLVFFRHVRQVSVEAAEGFVDVPEFVKRHVLEFVISRGTGRRMRLFSCKNFLQIHV
jgi:hypothetical protein